MLDPRNITNFSCSEYELQEQLLFWICVANKTAEVIAPRLDAILQLICVTGDLPFGAIRKRFPKTIAKLLKTTGIGCFNQKARAWKEAAEMYRRGELDLRSPDPAHYERIPGVGLKTSRCFILHTQEDARVAGLDTHVQKWLRELGYDVPEKALSRKRYLELEQDFLREADERGLSPSELDLQIWCEYAKTPSTVQA